MNEQWSVVSVGLIDWGDGNAICDKRYHNADI